MSDISPIKAKLDAKVDLTESTNKITNTIVTPFQYLTKGVKKICVAWGGRMIAKSERHNMLEQAQNEKDAEDIKSGKKEYRDGILLNTETMQSPQDYYKQISEHNEYCDAERLNAALLEAAIELSNTPDEEISGDPLDKTFFNRWRSEAELIDDEILRKLWARLLVEETKKPNIVSLRTLDAAKNLTKLDADLFIKVSRGIIQDAILSGANGHPINGSYGEILFLQDARLVSYQSSTKNIDHTVDLKMHGKCTCILFQDNNIAICFKKEKISYSCYVLTTAGQEIHRTFKEKRSLDDFIKITNEISRQNNNVEAFIYPIFPISQDENNTVTYGFADIPHWTNKKVSTENGETK